MGEAYCLRCHHAASVHAATTVSYLPTASSVHRMRVVVSCNGSRSAAPCECYGFISKEQEEEQTPDTGSVT